VRLVEMNTKFLHDKRFLCRLGVTAIVLIVSSILIWNAINYIGTITFDENTLREYVANGGAIVGLVLAVIISVGLVYIAWYDTEPLAMIFVTVFCCAFGMFMFTIRGMVFVDAEGASVHFGFYYLIIPIVISFLAPATMWVYELIARPTCKLIYKRNGNA